MIDDSSAIKYKKMKVGNYKDERIKQKLELKAKNADLQIKIRRDRNLRLFLFLLGFTIFFIVLIALVLLIRNIPNESKNGFISALIGIGKTLLYVLAVILSGFLSGLIISRAPPMYPRQYENDVLLNARKDYCERHRKFYGLTDRYIITTCYKSFDEEFQTKPFAFSETIQSSVLLRILLTDLLIVRVTEECTKLKYLRQQLKGLSLKVKTPIELR